jgi:hypothetical protein
MEMNIDAAEERELDEFGIRLGKAFALSGEPPSEQAIAFTDETVVLPERSTEEIARFYDGVWQRIERAMRESTGAPYLGAWVQAEREKSHFSAVKAAAVGRMHTRVYEMFEEGRVPVWRLPAESFARLAARLNLDRQKLLSWASIDAVRQTRGVYGRIEAEGEERSNRLTELADESEGATRQEFDKWRLRFIAAFDEA